jgi:hypothetical protein
MAKGDQGAVRDTITSQTGQQPGSALYNLGQTNRTIANQGGQFGGLFNKAVGTPVGGGDIFSAYGNLANTGGFSPEDISAMTQQATAPARGVFEAARNQIQRNAAVQGNQPNTAAALSRLGRQESESMGNIGTNAMGTIAGMQQQGKLYGLSGLSNLANLFGNQVLQNTGQGLQADQLRNQIAQMAIQGQLGAANVPGDFAQAMGNITGALGPVGKIGGAISGIFQ